MGKSGQGGPDCFWDSQRAQGKKKVDFMRLRYEKIEDLLGGEEGIADKL